MDYQTTILWFTVKEMQRDKLLQVRLEILLFQSVLLLIGINLPKGNIKRREKHSSSALKVGHSTAFLEH